MQQSDDFHRKSFIDLLPWVILSLLVLVKPNAVHALNVYSLVDEQCRIESGLITHVDQSTVKMLNLKGQPIEIHRNSLTVILVYTTLQNPIPTLEFSPENTQLLKRVYLENTAEPSFIGWPIRFIGEVVGFYDVNGEFHLVEIDKIFRMTSSGMPPSGMPPSGMPPSGMPPSGMPPSGMPPNKTLSNYQELQLGYRDILSHCREKPVASHPSYPVRILSDKINISQFLSILENGYDRLNEFEDRITYYAKPFIFEEGKRLGTTLIRNPQEATENDEITFPYFQWTSGRPYHYQGQFRIGTSFSELTPLIEPIFGLNTEVKFHVFRASFAANLASLGAGSEYFTLALGLKEGDRDLDERDKIPEEATLGSIFPVFKQARARLALSYNYVLLVGADLGPYSLGVGTYYPIYGLRTRSNFREVRAFNSSPIIRFIYSKEKYDLKALVSHTQYQAKEPNSERVALLQSVTIEDPTFINNIDFFKRDPSLPFRKIENYQFHSNFIRLGGVYHFDRDLKITLDLISVTGIYEDQIAQVENGNSTTVENNHFAFDHKKVSLSFKQDLGKSFAIRGLLNGFQRDYQTDFANENESVSESVVTIGGALEFIF